MNLVIIGGKNPEGIANTIYKTFDDINILTYANIDIFVDTLATRSLDIHRMLLLQDGIDNIPDERVYNFVDLIQASFPAMKLISICKEVEVADFLAQLFNGENYAHFVMVTSTGKTIIDFVGLDISAMLKKYKNVAYILNNSSDVEVVEEVEEIKEEISNEEIEGYISPPETSEKRGLLSKVFGIGPKKKNKLLLKEGKLKNIGQGQGVQDFEDRDIVGVMPLSEDEGIDETIFGDDFEPEDDSQDESDYDLDNQDAEVLDNSKTINDGLSFKKEEIKEEIKEVLSIEENKGIEVFNYNEVPNEFNVDDFEIGVNKLDLGGLKDNLRNTTFDIGEAVEQVNNYVEIANAEDTEIPLIDIDMLDIMENYEKSQQKVVEKVVERVVEKVVTINNGEGGVTFRARNGIRVILMTGDRRVGTTKLSLNLAGVLSKVDKVLYVDMDRNRHGSLGYLGVDNLLIEPEHIQNGLNHIKNKQNLNNVVYTPSNIGFYALVSMYGAEIDDAQMSLVQRILATQTTFSTVIIDCPIEDLYLLGDVINVGNTIVCAEDDYVGLLGLITALSSCCKDEQTLLRLYERSHFVVGRNQQVAKFKENMYKIVELFGLDEGYFDWSKVNVLGTTRGVVELTRELGE